MDRKQDDITRFIANWRGEKEAVYLYGRFAQAEANESLADIYRKLAETEDVVLTDEHWEVINYLRGYYAEFGVAPMVRKMLRDTGKSNAEIYELFPSGPGKGACKIAGLLKPTGCV